MHTTPPPHPKPRRTRKRPPGESRRAPISRDHRVPPALRTCGGQREEGVRGRCPPTPAPPGLEPRRGSRIAGPIVEATTPQAGSRARFRGGERRPPPRSPLPQNEKRHGWGGGGERKEGDTPPPQQEEGGKEGPPRAP